MRDSMEAIVREKGAEMTPHMRQTVMEASLQAQQDCQLCGDGPNKHLLFGLDQTLDLEACKSDVSVVQKRQP